MTVSRPLPAAEDLADLPTYAEIINAVLRRFPPGNVRARHTRRTSSPGAEPPPVTAARTALA